MSNVAIITTKTVGHAWKSIDRLEAVRHGALYGVRKPHHRRQSERATYGDRTMTDEKRMTTADALALAIDLIELTGRSDAQTRECLDVLTQLHDQIGCEHLPDCHDGRLTTLCDAVMFG
jgi:hypothetical protein